MTYSEMLSGMVIVKLSLEDSASTQKKEEKTWKDI